MIRSILVSLIGAVLLLVFLSVFGGRERALTPEQQRGGRVQTCIKLEQEWAFKLYSELTPEERRIKLTCDLILASEVETSGGRQQKPSVIHNTAAQPVPGGFSSSHRSVDPLQHWRPSRLHTDDSVPKAIWWV